VAGAAALALPWAAIGFAGLREYPELLHRLTGLVGWKSYSLAALGAGPLVPVLVLLALAAAAVFVRGDGRLLLAALGVALLATPILWPHYLLLLLVPLALARPAFSPAWVAPLVLWVDAAGSSGGSATRIAALLGLAAAGLAWSFVAYREESPLSAAFSASLSGSRPKRSSASETSKGAGRPPSGIGVPRFELGTFGPPDRRANQAAPHPEVMPRGRKDRSEPRARGAAQARVALPASASDRPSPRPDDGRSSRAGRWTAVLSHVRPFPIIR
jgi:hypothetical protein